MLPPPPVETWRIVRRLHSLGWGRADIAGELGLAIADVQAIVDGPEPRPKCLGAKPRWIRARAARGEAPEALAERYSLPLELVREIIARPSILRARRSRALPDPERERRARERRESARERDRLRAEARARRREDPWRSADDWRYRSDTPDPAAPPPPAELPDDQADAAAIAAELPERTPSAEPWTGSSDWRWHGPRKITPDVVAAAIELRAGGWSWPAIARELGVSRMGLYYAVRRPPA